MLRVLLSLCLLLPALTHAGEAAVDRAPPKPDDVRIQRQATTPTYVSEPAYAHSQCANKCQVRLDRATAACQPTAAASSAVFACMRQARATYLACVNACPVDAARVKPGVVR
jgi:hypothetical protein